jgi:hypothetical protein
VLVSAGLGLTGLGLGAGIAHADGPYQWFPGMTLGLWRRVQHPRGRTAELGLEHLPHLPLRQPWPRQRFSHCLGGNDPQLPILGAAPAETALTPHHSLCPALGDTVASTDFVATSRAHHIAPEETAAARSDQGADASTVDTKGRNSIPFPLQRITHMGACGKAPVMPHNRCLHEKLGV